VVILDISKTIAPRKKRTEDLDFWKSLTKSRYLENDATLGMGTSEPSGGHFGYLKNCSS
jgi:hypothetical protein